tara:strand:- start:231 stop:560 length:330 start_codon:yes stop_codon:yes gene_type:complete
MQGHRATAIHRQLVLALIELLILSFKVGEPGCDFVFPISNLRDVFFGLFVVLYEFGKLNFVPFIMLGVVGELLFGFLLVVDELLNDLVLLTNLLCLLLASIIQALRRAK